MSSTSTGSTSSGYQPLGPDSICTFTGRWIRPLDPDPAHIAIEDIAHSLSQQCRFTGHTSRFYSTAQHSVHVSKLVPEGDALWGLLHDATEAYLSDIARPVKRQDKLGRSYRRVEQGLMKAVCERFALWPDMPESVHEADTLLLWAEMRDLMFNDPPEGAVAWAGHIFPWKPETAERRFLARYYELTEGA